MTMSNYPGGFNDGVSIRDIPLSQIQGGKVFWVYNGSVLPQGHKSGSDGNDGTFSRPFSTLDYAVGRCTANRGDIIVVKANHAENVTTAAGIDIDVAGVTVVGLGQGDTRPTFTWSGTDATASIRVNAADVTVKNILLIASDTGDDIDNLILINADDVTIDSVEAREGAGQYDKAVSVADGKNRASIKNCKFTQFVDGAGSATQGCIAFDAETSAGTGHKVIGNHLAGDFEIAPIIITDATQVISDLLIKDNIIQNTAAGIHAIDLTTGSNVVGLVVGNKVSTTAASTAIRLGGAEGIDNQWGLDTKQDQFAGSTSGSAVVSVAPQMTITSATADEVAVVTSTGPIVITSIVGFCNTLHEAEAAAVFDNIVTAASGNLYAADQETALQDSAFEVGDYVVFAQDAPVVVEQATSQTEDSRGLNWLIAASDTIDIEGGSAEAEGKVTLIISYVSLGGELEVESV